MTGQGKNFFFQKFFNITILLCFLGKIFKEKYKKEWRERGKKFFFQKFFKKIFFQKFLKKFFFPENFYHLKLGAYDELLKKIEERKNMLAARV